MQATATGRLVMRAALALAVLTVACSDGGASGEGPDEFVYQNQIFTATAYLDAAASNVEGGRPSFSWPATGQPHVVLGVFRSRIEVQQNLIGNTDDLVWIWHSGIGRGREGNVQFEDGAAAVDERGEPLAEPEPLPSGTYYWAVWAIDEGGTPVVSSVEYVLTVP